MKIIGITLPWILGAALPVLAQERLTPFREALAKEGILQKVEVDGYSYCVADQGKGPPIVLLHGLGGSLYDWRHLMKPLAEDHRVITIDLLGAGESSIPAKEDYSVPAQARRVKGILDTLKIEKVTIAGNSYGGGIALGFAQNWPERVDRLVLINSICYADHIPDYVDLCKVPGAGSVAEILPLNKMTRWVLRGSYKTVGLLSEEELDTYILEIQAPGRREAVVQTVRAVVPPSTTEFEARLKSIQAPALLIWGTADQTVPVDLGRKLSKDLPKATLIELDAGHVPNQECPIEVLEHISSFMRDSGKRSGGKP